MYWIALTWLSGSWKTEVWKSLAQQIWVDFIDWDNETRKLLGWLTIPAYMDEFDSKSTNSQCKFPNFRDKESVAILNTINENRHNSIILSLGWWALAESQAIRNSVLLRLASFKIIFIDTDIGIIIDRKKYDDSWNENRKIVDDRALYLERYPQYVEYSDIIINNNWSIQDTIDQILKNTCIGNFVNGTSMK